MKKVLAGIVLALIMAAGYAVAAGDVGACGGPCPPTEPEATPETEDEPTVAPPRPEKSPRLPPGAPAPEETPTLPFTP